MSLFLSNTQSSALLRDIEALQQPGPAETTRPPVPSPPFVFNDVNRHCLRTCKSTPFDQFPAQAAREQDKLKHQRCCMQAGRRQTQPWDDSFDIRDNAYNNVRNCWIEQGIWREEWDEVWVKERAMEGLLGPFPRFRKPEASRSRPGSHWGHEDAGPAPDSAPQFGPEPRPAFRGFGVFAEQPKSPPGLPRRPIRVMQGPLGDGLSYPTPYPTARNSEGSRPYRQFLYQIVKEREWIKDEIDFQTRDADVDLDSMAYETVKYNWIQDGIWKPEWSELPGSTWAHEDPIQEEGKVRFSATLDDSGGRPSSPVHDWLGVPASERYNVFARPAPAAEVTQGSTDDTSTRAFRGAETNLFESRPNARTAEAPSHQSTIAHGTRNLEQASRFPFGATTSPRGETRGSIFSFAATPSPQVQIQPPEKHSEASKGSGKPKLAKRQSDGFEEQPPKWPRYNPQQAVPSLQEASHPTGTDNISPALKGVITKGEQLAERETVGLFSKPRLPSPGIAEGGGQRASDSAAEQKGSVSSSAQTKSTKRGRPGRGDQHDTPRMAKRRKSGKHNRGKN